MTQSKLSRFTLWLAALTVAVISCLSAATAAEIKSYMKKGSFDDVRFELTNVIVERGLKVDSNGFIGKMLERTGADVGSSKPLYSKAEYFTFCSAKLSREMMEADIANIGYCPYVVFIYEAAAKPGEIVVGYRVPPAAGGPSQKVFTAINELLDGIAKQAVK